MTRPGASRRQELSRRVGASGGCGRALRALALLGGVLVVGAALWAITRAARRDLVESLREAGL